MNIWTNVNHIFNKYKNRTFLFIKTPLAKPFLIILFLASLLIISVIGFILNKSQKLNSQAALLSQSLVNSEIDVLGRSFILQSNGKIAINNNQNDLISTLNLKNINNPTDFSLDESYAFSNDKNDKLEINILNNKNSSIDKYSLDGQKIKSLPANNAVALSTDLKGNIYLITSNGELIKLDRSGKELTRKKIEINNPVDITLDWLGNIYIASKNGLIYKLNDLLDTTSTLNTKLQGINKIYITFTHKLFAQSYNLVYEISQKNGDQLSQQVIPKNSLVAVQRFGSINKKLLDITPQEYLELLDLHQGVTIDSGQENSSNKDLSVNQSKINNSIYTYLTDSQNSNYQPGIYITSLNSQLKPYLPNAKSSQNTNKTTLQNCPEKPPIYKNESEIPEDIKYAWPRKTWPGSSNVIYLSNNIDNSPNTYNLHVGIESKKWDILVANGICPLTWIKDTLVDPYNRMLSNAKDANNQPVNMKIDFISWELYEREYFKNSFSYINYVPPWYPITLLNTERDIKWLIRPSQNEVSQEERETMNVYGINHPAIAAIDVPCEIPDLFCWGAVIHETAHAMELPDLYWWDMYDFENMVNGFSHTTLYPYDIMYNPSDFTLSTYNASILNHLLNVITNNIYNNKAEHTEFGTFYRTNFPLERDYSFIFHSIPQTVKFKLLKPDGTNLSNASVVIIPSNKKCEVNPGLPECKPNFDKYHSQFFKDDFLTQNAYLQSDLPTDEENTAVSDNEGIIKVNSSLLTRRDKNNYYSTTIKPERAVIYLIIAREANTHFPYYAIVEITQLNLAYFKGQKDVAEIQVDTQPGLREVKKQN